MQKPRVGDNTDDIGNQVKQDICCCENKGACLHDRDIARAHRIDHQLSDAGVDKHNFDHDDANDQIREVKRDNRGNRRVR